MARIVIDQDMIKSEWHRKYQCKICRKFAEDDWAIVGKICKECNMIHELRWKNGLCKETNATFEDYIEMLIMTEKLEDKGKADDE